MQNSKPAKAAPAKVAPAKAKPSAAAARSGAGKESAKAKSTGPKAGDSGKAGASKSAGVVKKGTSAKGDTSAPKTATRPVPTPAPRRMIGLPPGTSPFLQKQHEKLLNLRDSLLDSMSGVAKDTLRSRAEGSEASAFGMHQADAGSDAYDRDFALSLLSQEQDALYEIEEAIKRIEQGTYGICEMSHKPIAHARLEALPFARCTVECQAQLEKHKRINRSRTPVTSLFGLTDDEGGDADEEETTPEPKEEKE